MPVRLRRKDLAAIKRAFSQDRYVMTIVLSGEDPIHEQGTSAAPVLS